MMAGVVPAASAWDGFRISLLALPGDSTHKRTAGAALALLRVGVPWGLPGPSL